MPAGKTCSVACCKSNSSTDRDVAFFTFPKDPKLRKEWVRRCHRRDVFSTEYKRICSNHFKPEEFEDGIKAKIMGTHPKKLQKGAIPSLLLHPKTGPASPTERSQRYEKKERHALVETLLKKDDAKENETLDLSMELPVLTETAVATNECDPQAKISRLEKENESLKLQIAKHRRKEKLLKKEIKRLQRNAVFEEELKLH